MKCQSTGGGALGCCSGSLAPISAPITPNSRMENSVAPAGHSISSSISQ